MTGEVIICVPWTTEDIAEGSVLASCHDCRGKIWVTSLSLREHPDAILKCNHCVERMAREGDVTLMPPSAAQWEAVRKHWGERDRQN